MAQSLNTYYGYCEILAWDIEYFSKYIHLLSHIQTIFMGHWNLKQGWILNISLTIKDDNTEWKRGWKKMDQRIIFKKLYLAKYLIYEARISQESLHISKLCTMYFLCKSDPVEQKARTGFKWNDPYGSLTLTFGPSLKCTPKGFGASVW